MTRLAPPPHPITAPHALPSAPVALSERAGWLQYAGGVSPAARRANAASGLPSGITDLGYQQLAAALAARGQRTATRLGLAVPTAPMARRSQRSAPYYEHDEAEGPEVTMPWPPEYIDIGPIGDLVEGQGDIMYWAGPGRVTNDISEAELGTIISRVESFLPGFIQRLEHEAKLLDPPEDYGTPDQVAAMQQELEEGWSFVDQAQAMVSDLQAYLDKHSQAVGKQAAIGFTIQSPAQASQLGFVAIAGAPGMFRRVAASASRPGHRRTASVQRTAAIARVGHAIWEMRGRSDGAFDIVRLHDERDPDFRTAGALGARTAARVGGRYDDPDRDKVILTDGKGRPYNRPGPHPGAGASAEEEEAWRRSVYNYNDRVTNDANKSFSDEFRKKVKKGDQVRVAHGGAIRAAVVREFLDGGRVALDVGGKTVEAALGDVELVAGGSAGGRCPQPFRLSPPGPDGARSAAGGGPGGWGEWRRVMERLGLTPKQIAAEVKLLEQGRRPNDSRLWPPTIYDYQRHYGVPTPEVVAWYEGGAASADPDGTRQGSRRVAVANKFTGLDGPWYDSSYGNDEGPSVRRDFDPARRGSPRDPAWPAIQVWSVEDLDSIKYTNDANGDPVAGTPPTRYYAVLIPTEDDENTDQYVLYEGNDRAQLKRVVADASRSLEADPAQAATIAQQITGRTAATRTLARAMARAVNAHTADFGARWAAPPGLDLSPRGITMVDLLGLSHPDEFDGGGTYATWTPEEHRPASHKAIKELDALVKTLSRTQAAQLLAELGLTAYPSEKRDELRDRVWIAIMDRWFPKQFVNPGLPRAQRWGALAYEQATMPGLKVEVSRSFAPTLQRLPPLPVGLQFDVDGYHMAQRDTSYAGQQMPLVADPNDRAANMRVRLIPADPQHRSFLPMLFCTIPEMMANFTVVQAQPVDLDYDPNLEMPGESVEQALARTRGRGAPGQTRVDRSPSEPAGLTNVDMMGGDTAFGDAPTVVR